MLLLNVLKVLAGEGSDTCRIKDFKKLLVVGCLKYDVRILRFNGKTVHIFDIYAACISALQKALELAFIVGYFDNKNVGKK